MTLASLILATFCGVSDAGEEPTISKAVAPLVPAQGASRESWQQHTNPAGFSVLLPEGWNVTANTEMGNCEFRGPGGDKVIVWPVFSEQQLSRKAAADLLSRLAAKLWPKAQLGAVLAPGPTALRATAASGDRTAVFSFVYVNSPKGAAGYLYVTTAKSDRYAHVEPTFAAILKSFQATGTAPQGDAGERVSYRTWTDPLEGSFTAEVPEGWTIEGGLARASAVDVRGALRCTSPDGNMLLAVGDAEIPPFTVPSETLNWTGFTEGSWYSPGYGSKFLVMHYMTGVEFAKDYLTIRLKKYGYNNLRFVEARDLPKAAQNFSPAAGFTKKLSMGEVAFTAEKNGARFDGYLLAGTQLTEGYGSGMWHMTHLYGYLAPTEKLPRAQAAMAHVLESIRANPQWMAAQQQTTARVSQIVTETNAAVSRIITDSYWARQRTYERVFQRGSDARRGITRVYDEQLGREWEVSSGSNYYWIDPQGYIVGTDTYTRPEIDFRELVHVN